MVLGLTQAVTAMSTRRILGEGGGGKDGQYVGLTTLPLSCADCLSGFGGLVVSLLASSIQERGFKPGRSRPIP
jgi:hypothetical protein